MFLILLLLFTVIPALELFLLFKVGSEIGGLNTILIIILTGVVGSVITKSQGKSLLFEIQGKLGTGEIPTLEIIQGALVFAAGLMLITPGFFTDCLGFLMVIPPTRFLIAQGLQVWFAKAVKNGTIKVMKTRGFTKGSQTKQEDENIIDAEFEVKE